MMSASSKVAGSTATLRRVASNKPRWTSQFVLASSSPCNTMTTITSRRWIATALLATQEASSREYYWQNLQSQWQLAVAATAGAVGCVALAQDDSKVECCGIAGVVGTNDHDARYVPLEFRLGAAGRLVQLQLQHR
jgi:hypothetical protein